MEVHVPTISPLEDRESVEQRVAQTLRDLIVDGQLPAGTPLVQRDLAQQLGVSPTPVRAGLSQLEREGFVAVTPTGRAIVSRLTREDFEEIYAARLGLEGLAANLGARACGKAEIAAMKETLRDLRRLAEEQNVNDYLHQRWAFHAICYRASGRQRLVDEVGRLFWRADRYNRLVLSTAERFRESVGRYKEFLAACEAQDGDSAERVVHESLRWAVIADRSEPPLGSRTPYERDGRRRSPKRCARRSAPTRSRTATPSATSTPPTSASTSRIAPTSSSTPPRRRTVSQVLAIANEHRIPVTPFGVGTSLEGHIIPIHGGITLDLSRLDRIVDLSPANLTATVQAGVTRLALTRAAGEHGLFFPVDPGADATLGGMAATNAAGTTTVRYGKTRANVLALEAVLADGRVIRTGTRAAKSSAGYDLTGLLVGSEGTLAVITEVTVRLHAIPEHAVALRISFPDIESACTDGRLDRRRRRRRDAHRVHGRLVRRRRQRLLGDVVSRRPVPVRRGGGKRGARRRRPRARPGDRRG